MSPAPFVSARPRPGATTALIVPEETDQGSGPGQVWMVSIFFAGLWAVLLFWWTASGAVPVKTDADRLNTIGRVTALIGTYLLLWQLLLLSRLPWLERAFGMERLIWLHRWNGYLTTTFIGAHVVTQTMGYALDQRDTILGQLGDFIVHYDGVLPAIGATVLLAAVTVTSIGAARRGMSYQTWYFIHLYAYLAIALAFAHQILTGADFIANELFTLSWWLLYAIVFAAIVLHRLVGPIARSLRHGFYVARVEREASGAVSLYVGGRDLHDFHFEPGQFAIWRFLDAKRWWEAHPFSLSATPNGEHLRLTLKRAGDFNEHASSIRVGTPVLLEGPFGRFTRRSATRQKALLVAGGIGITPIRALAEHLAEDGVDVCVLYRCTREGELAFRDELGDLSKTYGTRVEYLLSDRALLGRPGGEWLMPNNLLTLVPDIVDRDIFVCGPLGMTAKVKRGLLHIGVSPYQIHTEAFQF
ncbi:MAG TPA: ferredoxin reductase family protein [Candidatus Acidoferrales bacterium]|nr:ferredoxin reductase family protein [Candidatus Acidoferrales bacterium]